MITSFQISLLFSGPFGVAACRADALVDGRYT